MQVCINRSNDFILNRTHQAMSEGTRVEYGVNCSMPAARCRTVRGRVPVPTERSLLTSRGAEPGPPEIDRMDNKAEPSRRHKVTRDIGN